MTAGRFPCSQDIPCLGVESRALPHTPATAAAGGDGGEADRDRNGLDPLEGVGVPGAISDGDDDAEPGTDPDGDGMPDLCPEEGGGSESNIPEPKGGVRAGAI